MYSVKWLLHNSCVCLKCDIYAMKSKTINEVVQSIHKTHNEAVFKKRNFDTHAMVVVTAMNS